MNLAELSDLLGRATDVLRVETLDAYSSASDGDMVAAYLRGDPKPDPAAKRPWLDRLAVAAERGHPWRRLRVVPRPVPDYVRYACEWGYVDNVAAGEDVRVLDERDHPNAVGQLRRLGDFYFVDRQCVWMDYDGLGAFMGARWSSIPFRDEGLAWKIATPFTQWWASRPELHRDLVGC